MGLSIAEKIMYSTTQIEMLDAQFKTVGAASGFIFGFHDDRISIPVLATNRHVLEKCSQIRIFFTEKAEDDTPKVGKTIHIEYPTARRILHPNESIDLAVLPIAPIINALIKRGKPPFYQLLDSRLIPTQDAWSGLDAIEDVIMVGYPKGLRDKANNLPIFRKGITATHPAYDYQGEPKFLIDMACFPGSSGSPVFIFDRSSYTDKRTNAINIGTRLFFLGVQCAAPISTDIGRLVTVPNDNQIKPVMQSFINLGIVIKSTELLAFEPILKSLAHQ